MTEEPRRSFTSGTTLGGRRQNIAEFNDVWVPPRERAARDRRRFRALPGLTLCRVLLKITRVTAGKRLPPP
jgi:hypothetical protein